MVVTGSVLKSRVACGFCLANVGLCTGKERTQRGVAPAGQWPQCGERQRRRSEIKMQMTFAVARLIQHHWFPAWLLTIWIANDERLWPRCWLTMGLFPQYASPLPLPPSELPLTPREVGMVSQARSSSVGNTASSLSAVEGGWEDAVALRCT